MPVDEQARMRVLLGTLASERNQRIVDAKPRIPELLWTGLLFGAVVLLGLGGFMSLGALRVEAPPTKAASSIGRVDAGDARGRLLIEIPPRSRANAPLPTAVLTFDGESGVLLSMHADAC